MIVNKQAKRDYEIVDTVSAGVVLRGQEVKSLREGRGSLRDAHARVMNGEMYLVNAEIPRYSHSSDENYDPKASRKLLLTRAEILSLQKKMEGKNLALVPLRIYFKGRWVKVELALARGRKEYEKKEKKKRRDIEREVARAVRGKV